MPAEEIINTLSKEEVLELKSQLIDLYEKEVFAEQLYLGQARKLEGNIVMILNSLAEQEQRHELLLKSTLAKGGVGVKPKENRVPITKINEPIVKAIITDIDLEDSAMKAYGNAIQKSTSQKIKSILNEIMLEEVNHLKILIDYKKENQ